MNWEMALRKSRKLVQLVSFQKDRSIITDEYASYQGQEVADLIKGKLQGDAPCMIARFGSGELNYIVEFCNAQLGPVKYIKYVLGQIDSYEFSLDTYKTSFYNAGIFPSSEGVLAGFAKVMLQDMLEVDILGSWLRNEKFFSIELSKAVKVGLPWLEPYYHTDPWTYCLAGKKVLVVHPFSETIERQYLKRNLLFRDGRILPYFNLKTIKAVQSIAGQSVPFGDWFEALEHMKALIDHSDFEIAIIGCGAYGFPLAAHVKRMGRKSIHLGGATQILFGIKGARWDNNGVVSALYNEHWTYPSESETPLGFRNVEGGCYW